jgi:hypothetical protein
VKEEIKFNKRGQKKEDDQLKKEYNTEIDGNTGKH